MDPFAELTNTERLKPIPGSSKTLHIGLDNKKGSGSSSISLLPHKQYRVWSQEGNTKILSWCYRFFINISPQNTTGDIMKKKEGKPQD